MAATSELQSNLELARADLQVTTDVQGQLGRAKEGLEKQLVGDVSLSLSLSLYLSIYLSIYPSIHPSIYIYRYIWQERVFTTLLKVLTPEDNDDLKQHWLKKLNEM